MRSIPFLALNRRVAAAGSLGFGMLAALVALRLPIPPLPRLSALPNLAFLPQHFPGVHLPDFAAVQATATRLDTAVVLIFVPVCALMFAIVAEAMRLVFRNAGPEDATPHARAIPHWQDD